jgi:hypothetical protein
MNLDRRSFLKGLIAISALPPTLTAIPSQNLTPTADVWREIEESPTVFFVRNGRTIDLEDYSPPATRGEGFDFGNYELRNVENLLSSSKETQPVMWELERQYEKYRHSLIDHERAGTREERSLDQMETAVDWPEQADDEIIEKWMRQMSEPDFAQLRMAMQKWADSEPNWFADEGAYFNVTSSGQEYALDFFENYAGMDVLDELEIGIVEGDHPGSNYLAAELYLPIDEANEKAIAAAIPIRFRSG